MRQFCLEHSDERDYHPFLVRWTDEEMANIAICLCHMVDKAMTTFLAKRDRCFVEEGGIRERMTAARLEMRGTQKQIIEEQKKEIAQLKEEIARQKEEIAKQKATIASQQKEIGVLKERLEKREEGLAESPEKE